MTPPAPFADYELFLFDAYGTLFDVHSAVAREGAALGEQQQLVSQTWRTKQLEYSWLRSLMGEFVPFWQITCDGLDFALATHGIDDPDLAERLRRAYLSLDCYPEVPSVLASLRDAGKRTAILSNGSQDMLDAAVTHAGLASQLDASLSVDPVEVFKPDPRVYQMACDHFSITPDQVAFFSSNAWDVAGAASFGYRVGWVNRFGQQPERLPGSPRAVFNSLDPLTA